jgi:pyruvate dehydrogenase (quinone)
MGPGHVVNVVDGAVKTALGRRTVAHISIPKDVQEWTSNDAAPSEANIPGHSDHIYADSSPIPSDERLAAAANVINAGSRVVILAGRGCLGARQEVLDLADRVAGPIIKPLLGKGVVPDDHPLSTGGVGLLETAPSQDAMAACDTLVMLGTSFPYLEFYPKPGQAKCVQVDFDSSRLGLRCPVEVGIVGDAGRVLRALLPRIERKGDRRFLESAQTAMKEWRGLLEKRGTRSDKPLKPQVVAYELDKLLKPDAVISSDCGTVTVWAARYLQMRERMLFSASGMLATMGNGLPYSIAGALAFPERQHICVAGDGGFTMMMGEVATLVKYRLPVKIVIFKNNALGMIKWEQIAFEGNPQYGIELQPIDFAKYAEACGAVGLTIEDPADTARVLRQALDAPGPVIVQAVIDPNEPPLPGNATLKQTAHFVESILRGQKDGFKILKTVLENKVRELV